MSAFSQYQLLVVVRHPRWLAAGLVLGGWGVLALAIALQESLGEPATLLWVLRYGFTVYACLLISAALQVLINKVEQSTDGLDGSGPDDQREHLGDAEGPRSGVRQPRTDGDARDVPLARHGACEPGVGRLDKELLHRSLRAGNTARTIAQHRPGGVR